MNLLSSSSFINRLWCCGAVVITTAQVHLTKPELRFYVGSNPARSVSDVQDGEDLLIMVPARNKARRFLSVNHIRKIICHHCKPYLNMT